MMDKSGAVTAEAIALNAGRATYEGGAAAKASEDERRRMILRCPPEKFLDAEHLRDCVEDVATWAPDTMRQKMLRKLGGGLAGGHVLRSDEVDELRAWVRDPLSR